MYLRLHLRVLLGLRPSPIVLPSLTICPIDYQSTPTQIHFSIHLGGGGGIRTRVLNTSSLKELQQYDIYYIECRNLCQVILLGFD